MSESRRGSALTMLGILALILLVGFGLSLGDRSPSQPGWWQRGMLSAGVMFVAVVIVGIVCTWLGNYLKFSDRINGAIVMASGFALLRVPFHLAGLSDENIFKSLATAIFVGTIIGALVGPKLKRKPGMRHSHTSTSDSPQDHEDTNR